MPRARSTLARLFVSFGVATVENTQHGVEQPSRWELSSFTINILVYYPHVPIGKVWISRLLFCVCLFICTVTDFSAEDKASGVTFCSAVRLRARQGISHCGAPPETENRTNRPARRQRPPVCKHKYVLLRGRPYIHTCRSYIQQVFPWANQSRRRKRHLDRFSRFYRAH